MKNLKKTICCIIIAIIILLIGQTNVFARTIVTNSTNNVHNSTNSTNRNNTTNSTNVTNNTTNELSEEDLIPALEEKLKEEQEEKETEEDVENNDEDEEEYTDANESLKAAISKAKTEEINEDIYLLETSEDLIYENASINGNIYIFSSEEVVFENCEITGNIFVISSYFELQETEVEGSIYILSENIFISDSFMLYAYMAGENIEIDENTEIENDLKIIGTETAVIDGTIGRDLDSITNYIKLGNNVNIKEDINISTATYEMPSKIEKSSSLNLEIIEIEKEELTTEDLIKNLLPELITEFIIILVIAIIILGGSPKFTEVNQKLKLSDFFKAFFTGILEILIINIIAILLMVTVCGAGYGIAILALSAILIYFGKAIFIISYAIRLVKDKNKHVRIKAFIFTIVVAVIVELINIISVFGTVGFVIDLIIDLVLGISGVGTFIRVILSSCKKKKIPSENSSNNNNNNNESKTNEVQKESAIVVESVKETENTPKEDETNNNQNKE